MWKTGLAGKAHPAALAWGSALRDLLGERRGSRPPSRPCSAATSAGDGHTHWETQAKPEGPEGRLDRGGQDRSVPGHPFYDNLNKILDQNGFDDFAEDACKKFYAEG